MTKIRNRPDNKYPVSETVRKGFKKLRAYRPRAMMIFFYLLSAQWHRREQESPSVVATKNYGRKMLGLENQQQNKI